MVLTRANGSDLGLFFTFQEKGTLRRTESPHKSDDGKTKEKEKE